MAVPGVTLTGKVQTITGANDAALVTATLQNYGGNAPTITGTAQVAAVAASAQALADGTWSLTLWGNDQIAPPNTYYTITIVSSTGVSLWSAAYTINSGSYDLSNLQPLAAILPVAMPSGVVVTNPVGPQQINTYGLTVPSIAAGNVSAQVLGATVFADRYSGADIAEQINNAIAALPASGGIVDARNFSNADKTCATTITLGSSSKSVRLLLGNYRIISSANPAVSVPGASWILGGNATGGSGFSGIYSTAVGGTVVLWTGSNGGMESCFINACPGGNSVGLYLRAAGTTGVSQNSFRNLRINGPTASFATSSGLLIEADSATALVDHNYFATIFVSDFARCIRLQTSATVGPTDNTFVNLHPQNYDGLAGQGISIASGALNQFISGEGEGFATGINITAGCSFNSFFGYRAESNTVDVNDDGTGTMFIGHSQNAGSIQGTDPSRTVLGQGNTNVTQQLPASLAVNGRVQALSTAASTTEGSAIPLYGSTDDAGSGYSVVALDHTLRLYSNGTGAMLLTAAQVRVPSGSVYAFSSGAITVGNDTGISRGSAGVLAVGNGTPGDTSGVVNAAGYQIAGVGTSGTGGLARLINPSFVGITNNSNFTFATGSATIQMSVQSGNVSLLAGTTIGTDPRILMFGSTASSNSNSGFWDCDSINFRSSAGSGRVTVTSSGLTANTAAIFNSTANKLGQNSITAATAAINSTETVVVKSASAIGANRLVVGSTIRVRLFGLCTSSAANASTFGIRIGTAGSTADTLVAAMATAAAAASGTSVPFTAELVLVVRTTGVSGTAVAYLNLTNSGTTGIATTNSQVINGTMVAFDTTANNFISATYKSAAATTTATFDIGSIEVIHN